MITSNAKAKIEKFNSLGLPSNIVAEVVYKKWWSLLSPFYPQYRECIIEGLVSFEMETMTEAGHSGVWYEEVLGSGTELPDWKDL